MESKLTCSKVSSWIFSALALSALACSSGGDSDGDGGSAGSGAVSGASGANGGSSGGSSGAGATTATGGALTGGSSGAPGGGAAGGGAGLPSGGTGGVGGVSSGGTGGAPAAGAAGSSSAGAGGCAPATCGSHKWACWRMPNPTGSGLPNVASYQDLGNGVIRDGVTCLEWELTPMNTTRTWQAALDYCEGLDLGGQSDWRLPTRIEMTSIVDFTRSPAIDRTIFTSAAGGFHKTASDWILTIRQAGAGAGKDYAWSFNMSDGIVSNARSKATPDSARCVRGNGAGEAPSAPAVAPPDHYTVATGEVRDNYTGLVWQQGGSSATMPYSEAKSYCAGLALNGASWRLPSVRELATLVDEARVAPSIDPAAFPDTESGRGVYYWASHPAVNNANAGWGLNFDDGFTGFNAGASGAWNYFPAGWVRCVR